MISRLEVSECCVCVRERQIKRDKEREREYESSIGRVCQSDQCLVKTQRNFWNYQGKTHTKNL